MHLPHGSTPTEDSPMVETSPAPTTETGCCPRFDPTPWDETEIELCAVGTRSAGVGTAQIGDLFPTTEESCGPAVVEWR